MIKKNIHRSRRASRQLFAVASILLTLSGCGGGILSGAGPRISSITEDAGEDGAPVPYKLIDITADTISQYARPADPEPSVEVSPTKAYAIKLVPGDVVNVMIADAPMPGAVFAPLATGGTKFEVRVDVGGKVSLPYVGHLSVAGSTPEAVENTIRRRLRAVATDPQVMVSLVGDLSGSVLVAGAVKQPGRFSALQGPLTMLDAINMAGGPLLEPHLAQVTVRTGSDVQILSYQDILDGKNAPIAPRSEIIVGRARKRFVAMGAVEQPGLHDLPSQQPSLLETLGVAGWLKESTADPQGVFVFRMQRVTGFSDPVPEVFRLNMRDPAAIFLARQFLVQPEDAVYVTNAAVYEWQKVISPIVQAISLGRTIDRGF